MAKDYKTPAMTAAACAAPADIVCASQNGGIDNYDEYDIVIGS